MYTPGVRAAAAGILFTRQMNDHTTRILTRVKTDATAKSEAKLYSELAHGTLPARTDRQRSVRPFTFRAAPGNRSLT